MNSAYPEVRQVCAALTVKIVSSCLEMNGQELGNSLFGLQNMSSYHRDVRKLLLAIAHKVCICIHTFTLNIHHTSYTIHHLTSLRHFLFLGVVQQT
ncbi:hypothetical protein EON63_14355 [archaeon]|nr:MAG: hypothetical protein EON63_14355 [archaeon]